MTPEDSLKTKIDSKNHKQIKAKHQPMSFLDWCVDYLPTCVLLTAGLGGLMQVYMLMRIDVSYVRFFSPSQIIPDGSLALAVVVTTYASYKLGKFIIVEGIARQTIEEHSRKNIKGWMYAGVPIAAPLAVLIFYSIAWNPYKVLAIVGTGLIYTAISASNLYASKRIEYLEGKEDINGEKEKTIKAMQLLLSANLMAGGYTILIAMLMIGRQYQIPTNLENVTKVMQRIEQDYEETRDYKIVYFNDKYLFVRLEKEEGTSIAVYDTGEVMYDKNIIVNQPRQ